jgi:FixJ family two-component response regulator
MPGLTGIQLQELLAATGRRMSIVFVSGHVDVKTSVKAMKAGAVICSPSRSTPRILSPRFSGR